MLDITKLDNPYVQVIWEDTPENFTQERIKRVRTYFLKKYNTTNVNVVLKTMKNKEENDATVVDTSFNILDRNYQLSLIKDMLKSKQLEETYDEIVKLDSIVENKLVLTQNDVTPFKKWYLKKIEFSNFLSYGENQVIDYETLNGIVVIESDPPNFAGKSIISLDLPLFLFFNTTTRTTKVEDIFNKFTDKNKVSVKGTINIDGDDYIISRIMERKLNKSGEWNVKSELEFFKVLSDGELQNFTGEQRRETEKFIKTSIGEEDDFLMTILTTGSNLESLLEAKPTARGQVLSRFLGLDTIKKKEEIGKEVYSEYSKGMLSNVFNIEQLKTDITNYEKNIGLLEDANKENKVKLSDVDEKIKIGEKYRDNLLKTKHSDIDKELVIFDPMKAEDEVKNYEKQKQQTHLELNNLKIVEPTNFYHEDRHDEIRTTLTKKKSDLAVNDSQLREIINLMSKYSNGITCEHCGIELINATYTQQKVSKKGELEKISDDLKTEINELTESELTFVSLKKEFDEYEKAKLIKEKLQLNLESIELKIDTIKDKIRRYNEIQNKIADNNKIEAQLIKAKVRLDELTIERDRVNREISNNEYQIVNYKGKIEENTKRITKILEESEKEKIYKIYLDLYGKNGVSKQIMKSMIPMINSELQRLMEGSANFNLEIRISDKNEVEFWMIDSSTGIEKLMITGSGYEKTISSLAIRSVLSKVCSLPKPNIIVFDEVFGKISDDNLEMVGEFFKKIKEYFDKVMIITHNPLISQWADTVVRVSKKDNVSKLVQE